MSSVWYTYHSPILNFFGFAISTRYNADCMVSDSTAIGRTVEAR